MVGTVWSVSCLLFFYSRCPPVPAICKSGGHVPPCPMESAPLLFTLSMQVTTLTLYSAGDSALGMCGCVPSLVPLGNSITGQHVLSMLFSQYSLNLFIRRGKDQYFVTDGIKMGVPNRPPFNPIFFSESKGPARLLGPAVIRAPGGKQAHRAMHRPRVHDPAASKCDSLGKLRNVAWMFVHIKSTYK